MCNNTVQGQASWPNQSLALNSPNFTDNNQGYRFTSNLNSIISCNTANTLRTGFRFTGASTGTRYEGNTIANYRLGQDFVSGGQIGNQVHTGNLWTVQQIDSEGSRGSNSAFSWFFVHTNMGTLWHPTISNPSIDLFQSPIPGTPFACSQYNSFGSGPCDELSETEGEIGPKNLSEGEVQAGRINLESFVTSMTDTTELFHEYLNWIRSNQLYQALVEQPAYSDASPVLDSLLNALSSTAVADKYLIEKQTNTTPSIPFSDSELMSDLAVVDGLLNSTLGDTTLIQPLHAVRNELLRQLDSTLLAQQEQFTALFEQYKNDAQQLLEATNDLPEQLDIQTVEKYMHDIYLRTWHIGAPVTNTDDQFAIETISYLCPDQYGNAVHRARAIYTAEINPNAEFDDQLSCSVAARRYIGSRQNQASTISIYPNPSDKGTYVDCSRINSDITKIEVVNFMGQVVLSQPVMASNLRQIYLNTSSLSSGLYAVKLLNHNTVIIATQLSVQRP
jgi:hypothetical protein